MAGETWKMIQERWRHHGRVMLGIALAATLVAWACELGGGLESTEHIAYDDALVRFTGGRGKSTEVVVVVIDQYSIDKISQSPQLQLNFGNWPYTRTLWARIAQELKAAGARAVLFDAVMDERTADESADLGFAQALRETGLPFYVGMSTSGTADQLARADFQAPVPLTAPEAAPATSPPEDDSFPEEFEDAKAPATPVLTPEALARALAFPASRTDGRPLEALAPKHYPVPPTPALLGAVNGVGLVDMEADGDGSMRRTHFAYTDGTNTYVTLPVRMMADLLGAKEVTLSGRTLRLGERTWHVDDDGSAALDYGGSLEERFVAVRLFAVLNDWIHRSQGEDLEVAAGTFQDKVVIIGGTAVGLNDIKATPFSATEPGMVKQATVVDTLLSGTFITRAPLAVDLGLTFFVALVSAVLLMTVRWTPLEVAWPVALVLGLHVLTGLLLKTSHTHVRMAMHALAGVGASVAALAFNHLVANRETQFIRQAFHRFMEPKLVEQMIRSRQLPRLDGENKEITAFFSDIRGFSTFSERFKEDPRQLVRILNTYLTAVSGALLREGGCLDKYIGDAVVCLFGAPMAQEDHAVRACRGALAAKAAVDALRVDFREKGFPDVYTRIGVNSAVNFVGNFGSDQLFSYTAIGDGMNLAARLEGANKAYGSVIMIGPRTYELAKEHIEVRELDRVRVAGKTEAVTVYELLALKGQLDASTRHTVARYHTALGLYREARFAEAAAVLEAEAARSPEDGPTAKLLERCREYLETPPEKFDGVANLEK
ncbi:adenylate/guanylate cyclase domain-containing protein [Corallococcus coralloides DSM 2259]|uniref:Adenylate/guanylate cyclase domain-containing protein n=1 Tax=Corallococcus coralloides (strain ATCC 25202 / DSM 2259 / NBRC 100086 / M2) TaxID=1144275 RepID=H8MEM3_CORCM|nr:adenylate/guanylate cyclase domain-containing protein [Corallococcus coralloides]AFE08466.1 adenylate/guanylate cyclase domain-containing protein [Corallococcus coralloides DSM 2259]